MTRALKVLIAASNQALSAMLSTTLAMMLGPAIYWTRNARQIATSLETCAT